MHLFFLWFSLKAKLFIASSSSSLATFIISSVTFFSHFFSRMILTQPTFCCSASLLCEGFSLRASGVGTICLFSAGLFIGRHQSDRTISVSLAVRLRPRPEIKERCRAGTWRLGRKQNYLAERRPLRRTNGERQRDENTARSVYVWWKWICKHICSN